MFRQAQELLRAAYAAECHSAQFEQFKDLQPRSHGERGYAQIGAELGMSVAAVKSAVKRFRQKYREALDEVVSDTVLNPEEVKEELAHLVSIYSK